MMSRALSKWAGRSAVLGGLLAGAACGGHQAPNMDPMGLSEEQLARGCRRVCEGHGSGQSGCAVACPEVHVCGAVTCPQGEVCCNASCGWCAPPGQACAEIACEPTPPAPACASDADCRLVDDYCTGCDCRALASGEAAPSCDGPGVQCLAEPCATKTAACVAGACVARPAPPPAPACASDADCRLVDDTCTGCDCRALASGEAAPSCDGPGVQCLVEPCARKTAACVGGACVARPTPPPAPACASDADCRLVDDYCTGCDCRALAPGEAVPACDGPGVRCFASPCADQTAACVAGGCVARPAPPTAACASDADCRLVDDYCTGCDCRALAPGEAVPACDGPGVRCFAEPCARKTAACVSGACVAK